MAVTDVKKQYTNKEWSVREDYYVNEVARINIPTQPNTKDILSITAKIDNLLSEALLEQSYIKRTYDKYKTTLGLAEKETFCIVKNNQIASGNKVTTDEIKGLVVTYLKSHPLDKMTIDIYSVVQAYNYRLTFIDSLIKMLSEKKMAIFADKAMISIDATLTNQNIPDVG